MKIKRTHLFGIVALTAALTINAGLYIALNKESNKVDAYNAASLPTTIDLNDCTEQEIRSYYSGLNSLSVSERKGTNLLKNLKPILMNNQKYYNYDNGDSIWKIYEIADRDWDKSPASSTTYGTYNSNTNTITNYQYGSGKNNPYIHALYINRNIENETLAWGNHNQDAWGINREHIWAKSHGFDSEGAGGARGDPMHLWAANGWANNIHSNYFFAFVDQTRTYTDAGTKYGTAYHNLKGYSLNIGGNETVFEPQDCDKGDIARAIFYMVARYNNYAGDDDDIDSNNPNLVLSNTLSENSRTGTSSSNDPYAMGLLSDLLAWNKLDPVDEYEVHRNNLLYKNYTNNRNPFIDFPNWADAIWGTANLDGSNYNSTTRGAANPAYDPIGSVDNSAKTLIEAQETATTLSYRYTKESAQGSATDTVNKTFTGKSGTTYGDDWTNNGTSGVTYIGQSAAGYDAVQLRSNTNSGIIVSNNPSGVTASSITLSWNSNTASGRTLNIYGKNTAYTATADLYDNNKQGTLLGTIVYGTNTSLAINDSYEYIGLRSNSGAMYIDSIQIAWGGGTTFNYTDVSIRFGGLLTQELWNELDTNSHIIQGFGVMITTKNHIGNNEIKDNYNSAILAESDPDIENNIVNHYKAKAEMAVPPVQDDNYYWNLFFAVTDLKKQYVAAAYIRTSVEYVFFTQVTYSAKTLAEDYLTNRGYDSSAAGGSLNNLANLQ